MAEASTGPVESAGWGIWTMVEVLPTSNSALPSRLGEFDTIAAGLDYAARGETGCSFFSSRGELVESLTYREIRERAIELALAFDAAKMPRGARLAIIAETSPDFLILFHACQYAGLVPVPLPLSVNLGGHEAYVARLKNMIGRAGVLGGVASAELIGYLEEAAKGLGLRWLGTPETFYALPSAGGDLRPLGKDEACYIQYSSGSTSIELGPIERVRVAPNSQMPLVTRVVLDLRWPAAYRIETPETNEHELRVIVFNDEALLAEPAIRAVPEVAEPAIPAIPMVAERAIPAVSEVPEVVDLASTAGP